MNVPLWTFIYSFTISLSESAFTLGIRMTGESLYRSHQNSTYFRIYLFRIVLNSLPCPICNPDCPMILVCLLKRFISFSHYMSFTMFITEIKVSRQLRQSMAAVMIQSKAIKDCSRRAVVVHAFNSSTQETEAGDL